MMKYPNVKNEINPTQVSTQVRRLLLALEKAIHWRNVVLTWVGFISFLTFGYFISDNECDNREVYPKQLK